MALMELSNQAKEQPLGNEDCEALRGIVTNCQALCISAARAGSKATLSPVGSMPRLEAMRPMSLEVACGSDTAPDLPQAAARSHSKMTARSHSKLNGTTLEVPTSYGRQVSNCSHQSIHSNIGRDLASPSGSRMRIRMVSGQSAFSNGTHSTEQKEDADTISVSVAVAHDETLKEESTETPDEAQGGKTNAPAVARKAVALRRRPSKLNLFGDLADISLPTHRFMISQVSLFRVLWDALSLLLLLYLAVAVPYSLGFGGGYSEHLFGIERFIDVFFILDVFLNFRTSYFKPDGYEVMDQVAVGKNYLRTWFCIDFISSVPWEFIFSSVDQAGGLQGLKVLKSFRVARALRLMKLTRIVKILNQSQVMHIVDEILTTSTIHMRVKFVFIFLMGMLICHWLACLFSMSGTGFLDDYMGTGSTPEQRYLASMYWAMTTMSTVGYGDITPKSDVERIYASIAMILGCGYWGFVLGSMTAIIESKDVKARAYYDRMDEVHAWVEHHHFPRDLRRRVVRYFKGHLKQMAAPDEAGILKDLSPSIREEVSRCLITDELRNHCLFIGVPKGALARMLHILQRVDFEEGETLVQQGDVGLAMAIITRGVALKFEEETSSPKSGPSSPRDQPRQIIPGTTEELSPGDSFGEEIVMGMEENYTYTVTAATIVETTLIAEEDFLPLFATMPDVIRKMKENYAKSFQSDGAEADNKVEKNKVYMGGGGIDETMLREIGLDLEKCIKETRRFTSENHKALRFICQNLHLPPPREKFARATSDFRESGAPEFIRAESPTSTVMEDSLVAI